MKRFRKCGERWFRSEPIGPRSEGRLLHHGPIKEVLTLHGYILDMLFHYFIHTSYFLSLWWLFIRFLFFFFGRHYAEMR